jgi:hypothetical protein
MPAQELDGRTELIPILSRIYYCSIGCPRIHSVALATKPAGAGSVPGSST